ncbi:6-hydroxymethylpterin diphosphokinase MptE-like protein [Geobacter grbiciae]|uniref:6-hydroxymethylpterin diphosphokinase MptE-like protein n=1 Tax=Geobacter grbiciae TaxID=155042 RepID=UPI001C034161|nr:6-hydroxymethylpterin diphosphokinase MptE-like protein [Geobacter grbiciae]MBT1075259.1 DUF115 domain-containing protein [Geobacter grbiciae]
MSDTGNYLGPFLVNDFGDRYLYQVNRNAFNSIGSDSLYASTYGESLFAEYQFNIIIGTDSGVFPTYVVNKGIPSGSRYLFIELPEVIERLSEEGILKELPPEVIIATPDTWEEIATDLQINEYVFIDAVRVNESIASSDANLPEYRDISWNINLNVRTLVNETHASINCTQYILRQLENLAENRVAFSRTLVDTFKGKTAVILAGGPSLREALPWVRENRDRLVLIAVSRISKILQSEQIVPHLVATVDPQKVSFEVSREMLYFADKEESPVLVSSYHASPLLVGQWGGRSAYTDSLFPWRTPLNIETHLYTGPTVSNYALSLAINMGCETIVLAGVDLCFSREGHTHAAGSAENKVGPDLGQLSPRIETNGGWLADTNHGYAHSLEILKLQAELAVNKGHRLYNISLGAAKIPLIEYRPPSEIELSEDTISTSALIDKYLPPPTSKARLSHYRKIKKELERAQRKFKEILSLSQEALECTDGLFGRNGKERSFRHKVQMDKIERKLDRRYGDFSLLIKQFGLKKFLSILRTPKEEQEWTDEQIEKATRDYYQAYMAGTIQLLAVTNSALSRIEARIEEEKSSPDCDLFISQWLRDGQPGRGRLWLRNHPAAAQCLSEAILGKFRDLDDQFTHLMTDEQTIRMELLEKGYDLKHIRSKARLLFRRGERQELEAMATGITSHPDREKAEPYLHFINGLIAELQQEPNRAIECYQHLLVDPPHPTTEDALRQIASLAIAGNDVENALLALECLSRMSPAYLSPYGEILKALGRYDEAFDAFNRYLSIAPKDVGTLVTLGILCRDAGLADTARDLFARVLENDPTNRVALSQLEGLAAPSND